MTPYRVLTALLALLVSASIIALGIAIAAQNLIDIAINAGGFVAVLVLLIAHRRGWRWSAQATVILTTLIIVSSVPSDPRQQQLYLINALIPATLALVLLPWYWSFGSFLVSFVGILAQADLNHVVADPALLVIILVMAGGGALAAVVSQTAQHHAE